MYTIVRIDTHRKVRRYNSRERAYRAVDRLDRAVGATVHIVELAR